MTDEELTVWEKMNVLDLQRKFGIGYATAHSLNAFIAEALRKVRQEERNRCASLVEKHPQFEAEIIAQAIRRLE